MPVEEPSNTNNSNAETSSLFEGIEDFPDIEHEWWNQTTPDRSPKVGSLFSENQFATNGQTFVVNEDPIVISDDEESYLEPTIISCGPTVISDDDEPSERMGNPVSDILDDLLQEPQLGPPEKRHCLDSDTRMMSVLDVFPSLNWSSD